MNREIKLLLALHQIENIYELLKDGPYAGFFSSHIFPIKFEIERQRSLLTNTNSYSKIKE
jgi:hypothetical protein